MKPWAAIVRVSHMGERKAGSDMFHADEDQVSAIKRYAAGHGAAVEFLPPELSISGGLPIEERPSLKAAIEGVEVGTYSAVVVAYLSRLTRSRSGLEIWDRVEAAGGHVHCAQENLDTSTPNGRFIRDIHLANAVREREEHTDRFDDRRRMATEAGVWQRRQTPRGYRKDKESRRLVLDRDAGSVRKAFRDYLSGTSVSEIARRLGMSTSGVRYLLKNRVYLGELRVGQHVNATAHEPLIDLETFEGVQQKRRGGVRPARNGKSAALLAGLCRCASCGHIMTRHSVTRGPAYSCVRNHSGERCPAPAAVMVSRLDRYVDDIARSVLAQLRVQGNPQGQLKKLREALGAAERELAAYIEAVSADAVGPGAFAEGARQRRETVDAARDAWQAELARTPAVLAGTGAEFWDEINAHDRNAVLRGFLKAVIVRPVGRGRLVPIEDRARVLSVESALELPQRRAEIAIGIVPLPFPDLDTDGVLRAPTSENGSQSASRAG